MNHPNSIQNVVILGDGDFPTAPYPLSLLHQADAIICCDGSIVKLLQHTSLLPDYIVGDMDTLSRANQIKFHDLIRQDNNQEINDQTKAFKFALSLNPTHIYILGATGGREDHTLGNISLLVDYTQNFYPEQERNHHITEADPAKETTQAKTKRTIQMVTDHGTFAVYFNSCTLPCTPGEQISIFAFDSTLKIESTGLKYPTDQVVFDLWWKASLNEALSSSFTLKLSHPARILLFRSLNRSF